MIDRSELARKIAACRVRMSRTCWHCGAPIEGTRRRRYCSHRCVVAAGRLARRLLQEVVNQR